MTDAYPQDVEQEFRFPALPPADPVVIDSSGHKHYRQEFRFEGKGFFGRTHAAILNWMRRNRD